MKTRLFIDANVLVAVLNKEYPIFTQASRILSLASHPRFEVYTSPMCLAIAFYFAEKKSKSVVAKQKISLLCQHIKVADNTVEGVLACLGNKKINDFDDGLEYYAALKAQCTYIITEDTDDFYFSDIKVLNCQNFFNQILAN